MALMFPGWGCGPWRMEGTLRTLLFVFFLFQCLIILQQLITRLLLGNHNTWLLTLLALRLVLFSAALVKIKPECPTPALFWEMLSDGVPVVFLTTIWFADLNSNSGS